MSIATLTHAFRNIESVLAVRGKLAFIQITIFNKQTFASRSMFASQALTISLLYMSNLFAGELSLRGSADAAVSPGATTDDTLMDGGLNAVVHLEVKLGELVLLVGRGFLDITEGGGIDDVTNDEALDGLVLGDGLAGGGAPVISQLER